MLLSDIRAAIAIVYVVLVGWRISVGIPEGWVPYLVAFNLTIFGTRLVENYFARRRIRLDVAFLASLDPMEAESRLDRLWSAHARQTYRRMLSEEGAVENVAGVERFPYSKAARRSADVAFWACCAGAVASFLPLFSFARNGGWLPWVLWSIGSLLVVAAGLTRARATEVASTLELDPFAIVSVDDRGGRTRIRWESELYLQNQPRRRRLLLTSVRDRSSIVLGYHRVGFDRLLRLTIEYGRFAAGDDEGIDSSGGDL